MIVVNVLKSRFISHSPLVLSHLVTSACNARCKICDLWKKTKECKNDLSKEDIFEMIEKAKDAGMVGYVSWGGEPLLRKDLPDILKHAKENRFFTTIITNGYFLKDRYNEIAPFTDFLIVSIDSYDKLHNEMRGIEGMLERVIEGVKLCKKTKMKIIMNTVVSKLNLDKIEGLLELSRKLGIPITFEPMEVWTKYNEHLRPTDEELKTVFSKIIDYKKSGYKIGNSIQYLQSFSNKKQYICHAPKCYITVDAQGNIGNINSCLNKSWGNIRDKSFKELFNDKKYKEFCKSSEKCNKCDVSCVIESSLAYSLNPLFVFDKVKNFF